MDASRAVLKRTSQCTMQSWSKKKKTTFQIVGHDRQQLLRRQQLRERKLRLVDKSAVGKERRRWSCVLRLLVTACRSSTMTLIMMMTTMTTAHCSSSHHNIVINKLTMCDCNVHRLFEDATMDSADKLGCNAVFIILAKCVESELESAFWDKLRLRVRAPWKFCLYTIVHLYWKNLDFLSSHP